MKTGFKNKMDAPAKKEKDDWFQSNTIPYDKRTGCYVAQGNEYGVGFKTPVGTEKESSGYAVPVGRKHTLEVDYP